MSKLRFLFLLFLLSALIVNADSAFNTTVSASKGDFTGTQLIIYHPTDMQLVTEDMVIGNYSITSSTDAGAYCETRNNQQSVEGWHYVLNGVVQTDLLEDFRWGTNTYNLSCINLGGDTWNTTERYYLSDLEQVVEFTSPNNASYLSGQVPNATVEHNANVSVNCTFYLDGSWFDSEIVDIYEESNIDLSSLVDIRQYDLNATCFNSTVGYWNTTSVYFSITDLVLEFANPLKTRFVYSSGEPWQVYSPYLSDEVTTDFRFTSQANGTANCTSYIDNVIEESRIAVNNTIYHDVLSSLSEGEHNYTVNCVNGSNVVIETRIFDVNVSGLCGVLQNSKTLTSDINVTTPKYNASACFIIGADNVTIDGNNHHIRLNAEGYPTFTQHFVRTGLIYSYTYGYYSNEAFLAFNNTILKNCFLEGYYRNIFYSDEILPSRNYTVFNNTFTGESDYQFDGFKGDIYDINISYNNFSYPLEVTGYVRFYFDEFGNTNIHNNEIFFDDYETTKEGVFLWGDSGTEFNFYNNNLNKGIWTYGMPNGKIYNNSASSIRVGDYDPIEVFNNVFSLTNQHSKYFISEIWANNSIFWNNTFENLDGRNLTLLQLTNYHGRNTWNNFSYNNFSYGPNGANDCAVELLNGDNSTWHNNLFADNSGSNVNALCLYQGSNDNIFYDNVFTRNERAVNSISSLRNNFTNNNFTANTLGFFGTQSGYNNLVGNWFNGSTGSAIDLYDGSSYNTIFDNDISYSTDYGLLVESSSGLNNISYNNITSVTNYDAIKIDFSNSNNIHDNLINNYYGLLFSSTSSSNNVYKNLFYTSGGYYINNTYGGTNYFNTSHGVAKGNYYDDILTQAITDLNSDGYGDSGADYPYNSTVSAYFVGAGNDYGPMMSSTMGVCGVITSNYTFSNNVYTDGACFIIEGNDITLNCGGKSIFGAGVDIGINVSNYENILIENCFISNFSKAVLLSNSNHSKIFNSTIYNNTDSGISLWDGLAYNISWTNMSYNTGPGINVSTTLGADGYLNDSIFQNNSFMFNNNEYQNIMFGDNFAGAGFASDLFVGYGKRINNATFFNNYFEGNLDRGISLSDAFFTNVSYNYFVNGLVNRTDSCGAGIYMDGGTSNSTISENTFINQQLYDICSNSPSNPMVVYDNSFSNSARGVRISKYSNVSYNSFDNIGFGILTLISSASSNIIQGNIINNSEVGLYLFGSTQKIYNNTMDNVTDEFFYVTNSNVSYNVFKNKGTQLRFQNPASGNSFHGNVINTNNGLYVSSGTSNNKFYNNSFQNASSSFFITNYGAGNDFDYNGVGNYYPDILDWEIRDVDGNGYGDSGADYPYSATTYPIWYTTQTPWIGNGEDNYPVTTKRLCGNLWYPITINVNGTVARDCLNITADDVIINCNNNTITGPGTGYFLNITNYSYFEIINCNLVNFDVGAYLQNTTGFLSWNSTYRSMTTDFHAVDSNGTILNGEALNSWVTNPSSHLLRDWTTYIYVHHGLGGIQTATVNVINALPKWLGTIYTGASGYTVEQNLTEFEESDGHTLTTTPHTFNASKTGYNYTTSSATVNQIQIVDMEIEGEAPPTIALNSPLDFTWVDASVLFSCTANDYNLDGVVLYGNWGGSWDANSSNVSAISGIPTTFSVKGIPDGIWQWNCWAYDTANQSAFSANNYTFTVDSTAPTVTITSPLNHTRVNGIVNIQTSVSDSGIGVDYVTIEYKNESLSTWTTLCTDDSTPYSCNWDASDVDVYPNASVWNVRVNATDLLGNNATSSIYSYTIDKQVPEVWGHTVTYPAGQTTADNGDIVNLEVFIRDQIAGVSYVLVNASEINGSILNMSLILGEMSASIVGVYSVDVVIDGATDGVYSVPLGIMDSAVPPNANNNTFFSVIIDTSDCANISYDTTLTADIVAENSCFNILNHSVTLDCDGYGIYGDGDVGDYAIGVWGAPATIKNCYIQDFYYGIKNFDSDNTTLTNDTFYHDYYGYFDEDSSGTVIQNSNFSNGNLTGVHAYYDANYVTVENSNFEDTTNGVLLVAGGGTQDYSIVRNNTFSNSGAIIYAQEDANVTNNSFDTARLMYAQDSIFYDNIASGTVDFVGDAYCSIYDNELNGDVYFSDNFGNRIYNHVVDGTTEWNFQNTQDRILNNNFTGDALLWISNSQNIVANNLFYNMDGAATYLFYSSGSGDNVSYNTFYNNTKYFIFDRSDESYPNLNNTFSFNNMTDNDYGLIIYSQRTKVFNNTFVNNGGGHGILGYSILDSGWEFGTPDTHGHSDNQIYYNDITGEHGIKKIYGNSSIWGNTINYSGTWAFNFVGNYYSNDETVLIYNNTILGNGTFDVYSYVTATYPQIINISNTNLNLSKIHIEDQPTNANITVEFGCYPQVTNAILNGISGAYLNYTVYNSLWGTSTTNTTTNASGYGNFTVARLGNAHNNSGTGLVWDYTDNFFYASKSGVSNSTISYPLYQGVSIPVILSSTTLVFDYQEVNPPSPNNYNVSVGYNFSSNWHDWSSNIDSVKLILNGVTHYASLCNGNVTNGTWCAYVLGGNMSHWDNSYYWEANNTIGIGEISPLFIYTILPFGNESIILDHYSLTSVLCYGQTDADSINFNSNATVTNFTNSYCTSNASWLMFDSCPTSINATENYTVNITIDRGSLSSGLYDGGLIFSADNVSNVTFHVILNAASCGVSGEPAGSGGQQTAMNETFLIYPHEYLNGSYLIEEFEAFDESCKQYTVVNLLDENHSIWFSKVETASGSIIVQSNKEIISIPALSNETIQICTIINNLENVTIEGSIKATSMNSTTNMDIPFRVSISIYNKDWLQLLIDNLVKMGENSWNWLNVEVMENEIDFNGELFILNRLHVVLVIGLLIALVYLLYRAD